MSLASLHYSGNLRPIWGAYKPPRVARSTCGPREDSRAFGHLSKTRRECASNYPKLPLSLCRTSRRPAPRKLPRKRLAHALVHLGHRAGRVQPTGVEVDITNEQLGGLADVGLFTASRVLSKWERKGAVIKRRGGVFIQSPERLLSD